LITQKVEDRIELVTRNMLESMVEDVEYMAVYFCECLSNVHCSIKSYMYNYFSDKPLCKPCEQILEQLENIDQKCDEWGIQMVKIQDAVLARRYSIKTFPALVYFRNGNPLLYDGNYQIISDLIVAFICIYIRIKL
jgi:thiol-disulfide isomerase/thioredoxin